MPVLSDTRPTKTVELPQYPGSKIEIYGRITAGDLYDAGGNDFIYCVRAIKSWNFTDEQEKPLSVDEKNVRLLDPAALMFLLDEIREFAKSQKKTAAKPTETGQ